MDVGLFYRSRRSVGGCAPGCSFSLGRMRCRLETLHGRVRCVQKMCRNFRPVEKFEISSKAKREGTLRKDLLAGFPQRVTALSECEEI